MTSYLSVHLFVRRITQILLVRVFTKTEKMGLDPTKFLLNFERDSDHCLGIKKVIFVFTYC